MPGMTGIISKKLREANKVHLDLMINSMMHESFYTNDTYVNEKLGIYIGWTNIKGSFADGPIWNERKDKLLLFYGEDFADKDIIDSLRRNGHEFNVNDSSYLIHLYEEKGIDFFSHLNGFFNGIIIDISHNKVILFNDRYGMQRVYYYEDKDRFLFSSEAKSLLKVCPELRELVPESVGQFFSMGCVLENKTLFKNVYQLPGASIWTFYKGICEKREIYFSQETWENQPVLEKEVFYDELKNTFKRILPKYLNFDRAIGISLTGGLDTRMIMAHSQLPPEILPCYTFGSMYRDSFDVKVARKVAKACNQKHYTLKVDQKFFSKYPQLAEKTVYITDGYLDVSGATELFVNKLAREIAPVRITGNYGSEVLRSLRAFRHKTPDKNIFNADFTNYIKEAYEIFDNNTKCHNLSFTVFKQAPWFNYNRLSLEQSQLTMRTPYMDNDLVALAYKAPIEAVTSDQIPIRLIKDGNIELSKIITNRGVGGKSTRTQSKLTQMYYEFLRKAELGFDYGMPQWYSQIDHFLSPLHIEKIFLGRQKFYHFRIWFRNELSDYVKEILLDKRTLDSPYLNKVSIHKLVNEHLCGYRNYTTEIHKLLTYEIIQRRFIDNSD